MDLFKQGMKGPSRPAPAVPQLGVNRYSPVTNWNDDPFGDVFEPTPQCQKKVPPPRPPPPRVKHPEVPAKPSHFIRKPTVLTSLLSRKKAVTNNTSNTTNHQVLSSEMGFEVDTNRVFPKCELKNIQTGTLIDFSSPPSSPTFTTRSSSDGLSVDSFGSDATTSTNHLHANNGGNASQGESGFEDDFDLFLNTRKKIAKEDTFEDFNNVDLFSQPLPTIVKPPIMQKPVFNKDLYESKVSSKVAGANIKGPTIIRAKPARPKPPDNSALLKNTFSSSFSSTLMNVNTTAPIQKIGDGFGDNFDSKPLSWESSPERESSPPMPSIPPPPPPPVSDEDLQLEWPEDADVADLNTETNLYEDETESYGIALFDYFTDHPEDLCFSAKSKIKLIRRVDSDWLYGSVRSGAEGIFPSNYVDIKVPLPNEVVAASSSTLGVAKALYDFDPAQPGDLKFQIGDTITVLYKLSDEWYFGQCNGIKGQFPANYVQVC